MGRRLGEWTKDNTTEVIAKQHTEAYMKVTQ